MNSAVTPRELLWHFKHDLPKERHEEYDKECREKLYDVIAEDTKYFSKEMYSNLSKVIYMISLYTIEKKKPSEVCEFVHRFNKSATGVYGLEYDNQTNIAVLDLYGNSFLMAAYCPKYHSVTCYEFYFYNMNGQGKIYSFSEKEDCFSPEHLKELWKLKDYQDKYYAELKASKDRYEEIQKYKEYISVKGVEKRYAHCIKEVTIQKNIPINLTKNEIAKYADNWNYCFGGSISLIEDNEKEAVYRVRINTD